MLSVILADYAGSEKDVYFLQNAEWLNDSTVIQYIYQQKGRWKVTLAFAWNENPMQIICRYMNMQLNKRQQPMLLFFAEQHKRAAIAIQQ